MTMSMSPLTERTTQGGILTSSRPTVERNRTASSYRASKAQRRTTQNLGSPSVYRNPVCSSHRRRVADASARNGLWERCQLLASASGLDACRRLARGPSTIAASTWKRGTDRSFPRHCRQPVGPSCFWGDHTGPNPTDRGKNGCKRHLIVDANGLPLAIQTTPANVHDSIPAMELVDAIPPCAGAQGRPRSRPDIFQADHAYGTPANFEGSAARGIIPQMQRLGRRKTKHGSGFGVFRYVVERTFTWLGHHRRLRMCYEKNGEHFQAFNDLAAAVICARRLATHARF